ncbi:MAG: NUDIX domain-containing protein [Bacteroidaceae bacterium]|nr:NUDIX domain-containing protein [Bacteroidaceae bacterium]
MHPLASFSFCPRCGSSAFLIHNEKSKCCQKCGFVYYANACSATVALLFNKKNELLVSRRAHDPAKGTLDLVGGFVDMDETAEEGLLREIKEETTLTVVAPIYLFSRPNLYVYSSFEVHTVDLFYLCKVPDGAQIEANDDVSDLFFVPLEELQIADFGLQSIRNGLQHVLKNKDTYLSLL